MVNKVCEGLKHQTKCGDASNLAFNFPFQFLMFRCGIQNPLEANTFFTCHIIICNAVAFPNQVVGGRESLLNKGNFFTHPVFHSHPKIGESSGALTLSIKSLCVNVWQWWNHGPSNAPKTSSAGTTTGFGLDPRQCNYWITGSKKEINNKSECGALAFSSLKRRQLRFFVVSLFM